ncbi:MAG: hypothetical protein IJ966_05290 [Bacilli bacterium]|nr:hypothetical protein [Bacilli bacterium]
MDKNIVIKNAKNKFNGELLNLVLEQINNYFTLAESNYVIQNKYQINDKVILNENHLLHGIGKHIDLIETFANRGVVSQDYLDDATNHAFCYESAFWNVKCEITLKEYIENYSGMVAKVNDVFYQVPYGKLDSFVEEVKKVEHWLWTAESSMEIRFMPSLAKDNNQIGFILNTEHELANKMRKNSVFKESFNKEWSYEFISEESKDKFVKDGFKADFFERADYLVFGLPKNCIEGILVGRKVENNEEHLSLLKELFPNCYICNLEGIVIK